MYPEPPVFEDFRDVLARELDTAKPPPLGRLAPPAMRRGRWLRQCRDLTVGASATAVVLVVLAAFTAIGRPGQLAPSAAAPAGTGRTPAAAVAAPDPTTGATRVAKGGLELLTRVLPAGVQTRFHYRGAPFAYSVGLALDRGWGPVEVGLSVAAGPTPGASCGQAETCYELPGRGVVAISRSLDDCRQGSRVELRRVDGIVVTARLPTCRSTVEGGTKTVSQAMNEQEAIIILLDPRWGLDLPADVEAAGNARFAELEPSQGAG